MLDVLAIDVFLALRPTGPLRIAAESQPVGGVQRRKSAEREAQPYNTRRHVDHCRPQINFRRPPPRVYACGWQAGHQNEVRAPMTCLRETIAAPQFRHGSPWRRYTQSRLSGSESPVVRRIPVYVT